MNDRIALRFVQGPIRLGYRLNGGPNLLLSKAGVFHRQRWRIPKDAGHWSFSIISRRIGGGNMP
jgi:hypothetical protein